MVFHPIMLVLLRRIVVERIAISFNGKYRLLADAVDDEEINVSTIVASVFQLLLRHHGGVLDYLSKRYMTKHFQVGKSAI